MHHASHDPKPPTRTVVTPELLADARHRRVPDLIKPGLRLLVCGINPGLLSAAVGYHFARPGNRFWPTLHRAGLTPRLLRPSEQQELLAAGIGITNLVERATAEASELSADELQQGRQRLEAKVHRYRPAAIVFFGITAYRTAFGRPKAVLGRQPEGVGDTPVWVLHSPSGLNAHFRLAEMAELLRSVVAPSE